MFGKDKVKLPLIKLELLPGTDELIIKKLFEVRYLLHRKVSFELPYINTGLVQCKNCQEYGHSRNLCSLPPVCVICGDGHSVDICKYRNADKIQKSCGNCGQPHTANYKGCIVYKSLLKEKQQKRNCQSVAAPQSTIKPVLPEPADFVPLPKASQNVPQSNCSHSIPTYRSQLMNNDTNTTNATNALINTMEKFMANIDSKIGLLLENMNTLLQLLLKNQK